MERIHALGEIGKDAEGRRTRLAASDAEKEGRDLVAGWIREAGLELVVDRIGNMFGIWQTAENRQEKPLMTGSHIDTVINAGQYDGCLGVIGGIEVIKTLREGGHKDRKTGCRRRFHQRRGRALFPGYDGFPGLRRRNGSG
ncbi:allantoate amidohydrolase [[Clostridium] asparagiforme DSM 15981]|uniref:Allantoate amidohydrolase n=2 Tax=Enterocloster asparagiformis TaxID=333367 RepID=C0D9W4_9FIRM|nr:allantoate amidohydrolase [[Clostridium] asparagiforme DSM 15981]